ncbi:hypothetical protein VE03_10088 [Pseudogymnoascus sp. 23342-1-I1]|nr:hypothetical protein VE03_10088 [Pseudogymnoascus sp. 23342-1-I1]
MKFSVITLACLASFAATAYSHADANVLEQRDDDTFKSVLKRLNTDLGVFAQAVHDFVDINDYYKVSGAGDTVIANLEIYVKEAKESTPLSEAGAADLKLPFEDLATTAKSIHDDFIAKKPALERDSRCGVSHVYMLNITTVSGELVRAIIANSDPKVQDLIDDYTVDYMHYLAAITLWLRKPDCVDSWPPWDSDL